MNTAAAVPTEEMLRATCRREHPHCFACSDPAEGGLGLRFHVGADGRVGASWECPVGGESYPGIVHGGLVATLLDAAMVHALFARGIVGWTGDLRVRYRSSVLIGRPVTVHAWMVQAFGPLYRLEAELRQGASCCAEAKARFMRPPGTEQSAASTSGLDARRYSRGMWRDLADTSNCVRSSRPVSTSWPASRTSN
jgi:acyl-coenzyme A thioesterase PaaI-like protein